jgi:hypothetical protein
LIFCVLEGSDSVTLEYYGPPWRVNEEACMRVAVESLLRQRSQAKETPLHDMLGVSKEASQRITMMHRGEADRQFVFDSWLS